MKYILMVFMLTAVWPAQAQDAKTSYPSMGPIDQYLMADANAEIALARSAAPAAISRDAEVLVLGRHGYETTVKGKNGFVCVVVRSWASGFDDPEFWNPKMRAPMCFNPPAVRSVLRHLSKRTELVFAGLSKAQMVDSINTAFDTKALPMPEPGAMCYMTSKQGYLGDSFGHWVPHMMFFVPQTDGSTWGAGLPDSPVMAHQGAPEPVTVFLVPVLKWSDGTPAPTDVH